MDHCLSIISVVLNEAGHLSKLIKAVEQLENGEDVKIETILVDGGSTDGTAELARELGFTKISELPGANIPVCRNEGLRLAEGNWIAFIDGDCAPGKDWLNEATHWLKREKELIMGWPVVPPPNGTWVQRAWHIHWSNKNPRLEQYRGENVVQHDAFRLITTRNMILHRSVADKLEGFDENLPTGEDTDFVFRAYALGIRVLAIPTLEMIHHGEPATYREYFKQQAWHANRESYKTIAKKSGGRFGANAPLFTLLYLICAILLSAGLLLALIQGAPWYLLCCLPLPGLIAAPAAMIALKAKKPLSFPLLFALYAGYGLARVLDLIGFYRNKKSWKSEHITQ